ncbi:DUF885 domain-containing protein [Nannocystaceae bacterium ST9]
MLRAPLLLGVVLAFAACKPGDSVEPEPHSTMTDDPELAAALADAHAGVTDPALAELLRDHWAHTLESSPSFATSVDVHAWDDRWAIPGPEADARQHEFATRTLARAKAIDPTTLDESDRVSLELLIHELELSLASEVCRFRLWSVGSGSEALVTIAETQPLDSPAQGTKLLARMRGFGELVDAKSAGYREGLRNGLVADRASLELELAKIERTLADDPPPWNVAKSRVAGAPGWTSSQRDAFERELAAATREVVRPALERLATQLRDELIPAGRDADHVGLVHLANGEACYAAEIRRYIDVAEDPDDLHALGLREIERVDAEFRELGQRVFGTDDLAAILERLRSDPALYFDTSEAVESFARESLANANAELPRWFNRLPQAPCEVKPIPDHLAPFTYVGYYEPPTNGLPGYYAVNTHAPTTRTRYEARVLAVHESVPGHHLQIAIAHELPATPAFRRFGGSNAFTEGWALYTERLADEMGLYRDDLDRLGVLSFDAWRAARLVVDTGLHAKGWTRAQAVEFLHAHTALADNNIANEVDRYVGWPGQALGYKYGQLELLRLRAQAEASLGEGFAIADFHDVVLGGGALTLPILRRRVEAWIASQ